MKTVGFTREISLQHGRHRASIGTHEVMRLPARSVDELRRFHGDAVVDLSSNAVGEIWGVFVPLRVTTIRLADCECVAQPRLTACEFCNDTKRLVL